MSDPASATGWEAAPADEAQLHLTASRSFADSATGRWLRIEYSQSFAGQPARFLLRFVSSGRREAEHVLPAAVLGRARWVGIVPERCDGFEVWSCRPDADLSLDRVRRLSSLRLALEIAVTKPLRLPAFLIALLRAEPRTQMLRALTALDFAPIEKFSAFARTRSRPVDDRDRASGSAASPDESLEIDFLIFPGTRSPDALEWTLASLDRQSDTNFRIVLAADDSPIELPGIRTRYPTLDVVAPSSGRPLDEPRFGRPARWYAELCPGDALPPEAVLALRSFLHGQAGADVVYTDHAIRAAAGASLDPCLKPDWSPCFYEGVDYIERLCLVRGTHLDDDAFDGPHAWRACVDNLLLSARSRQLRVEHLKRVLITTPAADRAARNGPAPRPSPPSDCTASVIIPTRDRVELLRAAIDSLRSDVARGRVEILVVDNGSTEPECLRYLDSIARDDGIIVLNRPGAFNFSSLVNAGAARATGDVLILLNNDCAVLHEGWLQEMTTLALDDDVGAVGAKLLYDNGKLQHAGVGIGLGGEAGHRNRGEDADFAGYLDRLHHVHEVSAVTAACLAVARSKFHHVGGFDEAFAVAFNDIDFCLRLRAQGFRNLFTPHATLRHSESVSRGSDRQPSQRERWAREATLFRQRWQHVILDDPYMHPLFSLWRFRDVLQ